MNYIVKRLFQTLFTIWAVVTLSFALIRWMPGGPLDYLRAQFVQGQLQSGQLEGQADRQLEAFDRMADIYLNVDLDQPLHLQYVEYVQQLLSGSLGRSIYYQESVEEVLFPAVPWTVFIGAVGILVSFVTMVIIGSALAYKEGSTLDFGGTTALIWGHSLPFYIVAVLMLYVFGYQFGWFPVSGRYNPNAPAGLNVPFVAGILRHATLPVISLAWASFGAGAIAMRANAIQVLGEDYIRVAKLRGITSQRITLLYVARNAILPLYTNMLIQIGFIFSGSIILEMVFEYRGIGWYMFQAIQTNDYPLMMGCFILITVGVAVAMLIADLTYGLVDPRVQRGESDEAF